MKKETNKKGNNKSVKKKVTKNPISPKNNIKENVKKEKININERDLINEDAIEIRKFIIITLIIVIILFGVFFFTKYIINDGDVFIPEVPSVVGQVNYDVVSVGTMLNKPGTDYYIMIYDSTTASSSLYYSYYNLYRGEEDGLMMYYSDLDNELNKQYLATDERPENASARSLNDLSLGEITLIKVSNGNIVEYYNDLETIKNVLNVNES